MSASVTISNQTPKPRGGKLRTAREVTFSRGTICPRENSLSGTPTLPKAPYSVLLPPNKQLGVSYSSENIAKWKGKVKEHLSTVYPKPQFFSPPRISSKRKSVEQILQQKHRIKELFIQTGKHFYEDPWGNDKDIDENEGKYTLGEGEESVQQLLTKALTNPSRLVNGGDVRTEQKVEIYGGEDVNNIGNNMGNNIGNWNNIENRNNIENKDPRESKDPKEPRDPKESKDPREPWAPEAGEYSMSPSPSIRSSGQLIITHVYHNDPKKFSTIPTLEEGSNTEHQAENNKQICHKYDLRSPPSVPLNLHFNRKAVIGIREKIQGMDKGKGIQDKIQGKYQILQDSNHQDNKSKNTNKQKNNTISNKPSESNEPITQKNPITQENLINNIYIPPEYNNNIREPKTQNNITITTTETEDLPTPLIHMTNFSAGIQGPTLEGRGTLEGISLMGDREPIITVSTHNTSPNKNHLQFKLNIAPKEEVGYINIGESSDGYKRSNNIYNNIVSNNIPNNIPTLKHSLTEGYPSPRTLCHKHGIMTERVRGLRGGGIRIRGGIGISGIRGIRGEKLRNNNYLMRRNPQSDPIINNILKAGRLKYIIGMSEEEIHRISELTTYYEQTQIELRRTHSRIQTIERLEENSAHNNKNSVGNGNSPIIIREDVPALPSFQGFNKISKPGSKLPVFGGRGERRNKGNIGTIGTIGNNIGNISIGNNTYNIGNNINTIHNTHNIPELGYIRMQNKKYMESMMNSNSNHSSSVPVFPKPIEKIMEIPIWRLPTQEIEPIVTYPIRMFEPEPSSIYKEEQDSLNI